MTTQKLFKRRVRERMSKTGETYTAARRQVVLKRERLDARTSLASATELASDERVIEMTGRGWEAEASAGPPSAPSGRRKASRCPAYRWCL